MTKIAFTTHEKVLVELRSALRGDEFNKNEFIKSCLVYKYLCDKYFKKTIGINLITCTCRRTLSGHKINHLDPTLNCVNNYILLCG